MKREKSVLKFLSLLTGMIIISAIAFYYVQGNDSQTLLPVNDRAEVAELTKGSQTSAAEAAEQLKCGEGKCGEGEGDSDKQDTKKGENKCGEGKCGEGKEKGKKDEKSSAEKKDKGKCGEGKCGE